MISSFYLVAGFNHFLMPEFYYSLIPSYLRFIEEINFMAGIVEILIGIGFAFSVSRLWASRICIAMLIAFIPSHVYFIEIGSCVKEGLCVPEWIAWIRLLLIHPLLVLWAWRLGKVSSTALQS